MTRIDIPDKNLSLVNSAEISKFLEDKGILFQHWTTSESGNSTDQKELLDRYQMQVDALMKERNYQSADVVTVNSDTKNIEELRAKFLREHTHDEDEVRFFVKGSGQFWFRMTEEPVFSVLCQKGDLIAVPANTPHWFDLGPNPDLVAIRLFTNPSGWVANYTNSGIETKYQPCQPG